MNEQSAFYKAHSEELRRMAQNFERQLLEDVAPFWTERSEDTQFGGYLNSFDRQGRLTCDEKPGWFVGRGMAASCSGGEGLYEHCLRLR